MSGILRFPLLWPVIADTGMSRLSTSIGSPALDPVKRLKDAEAGLGLNGPPKGCTDPRDLTEDAGEAIRELCELECRPSDDEVLFGALGIPEFASSWLLTGPESARSGSTRVSLQSRLNTLSPSCSSCSALTSPSTRRLTSEVPETTIRSPVGRAEKSSSEIDAEFFMQLVSSAPLSSFLSGATGSPRYSVHSHGLFWTGD